MREINSLINILIIEYHLKFKSKVILLFFFLFSINVTKFIKIDNLINEKYNQDDKKYSQFKTNYKVVVIFYPENYINNENGFNKKSINIFKNKDAINTCKSLIKRQIKIAKNHGIFGFGIIYNMMIDFNFNKAIYDSFLYDNMDNFPFFLIINYKNISYTQSQNSLIKNSIKNKNNLITLIESIKKYFISENYIKLKGKPILGIFHSVFALQIINIIRKDECEKKKNEIYIISIHYGNDTLEYINSTNSLIEFPSEIIEFKNKIKQKYIYNSYFKNLYKDENNKTEQIKKFFVINGCHPEKFYVLLKNYLNLFNPKEEKLLLFNAWNNFQDNLFLEPHNEFGFEYLNYFSKALFNLDNEVLINLDELKKKCKVAIQVHLFYLDLMNDIINKTNNIPVKFDLFISINFAEKYQYIKDYIKFFSKANYFEIIIVKNKGRDVLPFLTQFKTKYRFYKYICHIHTKKSNHAPEKGFLWRNYLFNNLLGNIQVISEILNDFEKNKKLGFIFPDTFDDIIEAYHSLSEQTKNWMNFLASKLFHNCKLGKLEHYPAGNMFWAKTAAIFQIFTHNFAEYFPNEDNQISKTIMHGIERIWLYLVKFNHFEYKIIFKIF